MLVPAHFTRKPSTLTIFAKAAVATTCVTIVPVALLTLGAIAAGFVVPVLLR